MFETESYKGDAEKREKQLGRARDWKRTWDKKEHNWWVLCQLEGESQNGGGKGKTWKTWENLKGSNKR